MDNKKDILIFLSDQHAGSCAGYAGDNVVRTPNLDRIASDGTVFDSAYTSCPLCVPARMSMLTGRLPSGIGVLDNDSSISSDTATFLHSLGAEGYETVLCGRMHFMGTDQRHGFTKRIAKDITRMYPGDFRAFPERKHYAGTFSDFGCLDLIGGGEHSPTLDYDRYVVNTALEYLKQDHEKPQCIVVGTYAPHFPYVAPLELYNYYINKVEYPQSLSKGYNYDHPVYGGKITDKSEETVLKARAAYWGMVEFMDNNIGIVYDAWNQYLERNEREGLFTYLSDHGDQAGERGLYGKMTFFDSSARIPMVFQGSGVLKGKKINSNSSIMDLGPTLCDFAGAQKPPEQDGKSLIHQLQEGKEDPERYIVSEFIETDGNGRKVPGKMVKLGNWKYITYRCLEGYDLLFDLEKDPWELKNVSNDYPDIVSNMRDIALKDWDAKEILREYKLKKDHLGIISKWVSKAKPDDSERWRTTPESIGFPEVMYKSSNAVIPEYVRKRKEMIKKTISNPEEES